MIRRSVSSWRLAGSAGADAAAGAREVGPQPGQARQLVLELGQLDLEAALVGLGVLGEDVEDQPAAVEDLDLEQALERLLLVGRELVVGDEEREAGLRLGVEQLLGLALAEVPVGVDVAAVLPLRADDLGAGRVGERGKLVERCPRPSSRGRRRCRRRSGRPSRGRGEIDQGRGIGACAATAWRRGRGGRPDRRSTTLSAKGTTTSVAPPRRIGLACRDPSSRPPTSGPATVRPARRSSACSAA